jgi:hypothetical protein
MPLPITHTCIVPLAQIVKKNNFFDNDMTSRWNWSAHV